MGALRSVCERDCARSIPDRAERKTIGRTEGQRAFGSYPDGAVWEGGRIDRRREFSGIGCGQLCNRHSFASGWGIPGQRCEPVARSSNNRLIEGWERQMSLKIRGKENCRWDLISLGEVMLRLDPGEKRIWTTRSFDVYEGGGEYNVARGLKRCFGMDTALVTVFADNPVGRLLQDLIYQGGVDQSLVRWVPYDGVGRTVRNGLNFTERGFGVRAALGCSDRGLTAISQLKAGEIDWEKIFGVDGARWFHTGGIFCALSETTPEVAKEAMVAARKHGTLISYDLNYRDSLWKSIG